MERLKSSLLPLKRVRLHPYAGSHAFRQWRAHHSKTYPFLLRNWAEITNFALFQRSFCLVAISSCAT